MINAEIVLKINNSSLFLRKSRGLVFDISKNCSIFAALKITLSSNRKQL